MKKEIDRIPYNTWINSHLSVAKYYGSIKINGKEYVLDFKSKPKSDAEKWFPDLIYFE